MRAQFVDSRRWPLTTAANRRSTSSKSWQPADDGPLDKPNETIFARRTFELPALAAAEHPPLAILSVSCDDHAKVWINGQRVATNDNWQEPTQVSVAEAVHGGKNVIALSGINDKGPAGLIVRLSIQLADGSIETVATDKSWRMSPAVMAPAGRSWPSTILPGRRRSAWAPRAPGRGATCWPSSPPTGKPIPAPRQPRPSGFGSADATSPPPRPATWRARQGDRLGHLGRQPAARSTGQHQRRSIRRRT